MRIERAVLHGRAVRLRRIGQQLVRTGLGHRRQRSMSARFQIGAQASSIDRSSFRTVPLAPVDIYANGAAKASYIRTERANTVNGPTARQRRSGRGMKARVSHRVPQVAAHVRAQPLLRSSTSVASHRGSSFQRQLSSQRTGVEFTRQRLYARRRRQLRSGSSPQPASTRPRPVARAAQAIRATAPGTRTHTARAAAGPARCTPPPRLNVALAGHERRLDTHFCIHCESARRRSASTLRP